MLAAYVAVTFVAAIAYAYAAVLNFTHDKSVAKVAERLRVPCRGWSGWASSSPRARSGWCGLRRAGARTAAACGLVLYFVSAAGAHIRARDTRLLNWVNWAAFFSLAVAALAVGLAYRGPW